MTFNEFLGKCTENFVRNRSWRWGQTVFNTLAQYNPALTEEIRASDLDPYYVDDTETYSILDKLQARWEATYVATIPDEGHPIEDRSTS